MKRSEAVQFLFSKAGKYGKKTCKYSNSSQRNYLKDLYFTKLILKAYPKDLETSDVELKQASQEATDHFIMNKQKRAHTNKKTATDMNTPLRFMEVDGMKMIELKAYLPRWKLFKCK